MMRVLLINKFYYRRGGDCIYTLNVEQMLKQYGHEVAVFAMQYPNNELSEWSKYWPPNMNMVNAFTRPFGAKIVVDGFTRLIKDFQPDVIHLNNIHTQLSPIIAKIAHENGIRIVWTLHDYKLLCPRYDCLRNGRYICEMCFYDKCNVLRYHCMKNSFVASIIAYWEALKWNRKRLESYTDIFICPSQFMADAMKRGGYDEHKLKVVHNFIDTKKCQFDNLYEKQDYYCYIGRLSHEKGLNTLISVANTMPYKLIVVGQGPISGELQKKAQKHIEFVGFKQWEEIKEIVRKSKFTVIPSEWNEVFGLVNIESFCLGTPVLGARIGGIPELVEENVNGMTFESGNLEDLKDKIERMFGASFDYKGIAEKATVRYSGDAYYEKLIKYYKG